MDTEVQVVFHDECQLLDFGESRTSGPWIKLRLRDHTCLDAFRAISGGDKTTPNLHVTIAQGDIATLAQQADEKPAHPHADASALLWKSGFFRTPDVWRALDVLDACDAARKAEMRAAQELAWNALKLALGYESMAMVPPQVVWDWAKAAGVERHLPKGYWTES